MQASLLDTDQFGQTSAGGARAKPVLRAEPSAGSITCIYFSYINCIHHLPTSPTSYSTAHATTRPPPLLLTPGVHHTPRWPRPRRPAPAPPCPAVKEPDNGHRDPDRRPLRLPQTPKSSLTRSAFGLRRPEPLPSLVYLARSVPSSFTRSMRLDTAFITTAFLLTALTTTVSASPVFAPQGTHHAPKAASPPPLACPPACTCPPTSALANHSSLVLLPRPAAACHDPHARASALCSHECPLAQAGPAAMCPAGDYAPSE